MTNRQRLLAPIATLAILSLAIPAPAAGPPSLQGQRRALGQQLPKPGNGHQPAPVPPLPPPPRYIPTCSATTTTGEVMNVVLHAPLPGDTSSAYEPDCPPTIAVEGSASVGLLLSDIYFIIDSSGSTGACTGSDIDGDGITGTGGLFGGCSDPDDTVLAAEVKAVRDFVATLSPTVSRVAIIQFSMPEGSGGMGERERIVSSLSSDFAVVNAALDEIRFYGSAGATDYGGALELLITERSTNGLPATRRQFAYFLSDGIPTYPVNPYGTEEPGDSQWAVDHAETCASLGIRIDTFGIGFIPSTTQDPFSPPRCMRPDGTIASTLECVALTTGGDFFASNNPADIVDRLRLSQPAGIESVTVFNDTLSVSALATLTPDGLFAVDIAISQGEINHLRVVVIAQDGTTCELDTDYLSLCFAGGAAGCAPLTQGYWHRQCMGMGLIDTGGRGGPPRHPDWDPAVLGQLMASIVDPQVAALGSPTDLTACQGLDADPPDDMCQKAIKQFTAVLMNMVGGRLGTTCVLDIPDIGMTEVDPSAARDAIAALIQAGLAGDASACQRANDAADLINTGAAVR